MPFTRPSILLPQSVYFDRNRQFALSGDGGQLYGEHRTLFGDFILQFNVFHSRVGDPGLKDAVAGDSPGELQGETSWAGRLIYEKDAGRLRFALSGAQIGAEFNPMAPNHNKNVGNFEFKPIVLSAQYNAERWSFTSEYALRGVDLSGFGPSIPDTNFTGESYYVQGTYKFYPHLEGILRYDVLYRDKNDRNGRKIEDVTGGTTSAHSQFAKDWTIGVSWEPTSSFMLRAEYHLVDGTAWLSNIENPSGSKQHWDLFAILAAYRF
jgi:hypothetical protein